MSGKIICSTLLAALAVGCSTSPPRRSAPRRPNAKRSSATIGVVLVGRSVTQGWFRYWGVAPERGVTKGRFQLLHRVFDDYTPSESGWPEQIDRITRRYARHIRAVQYKHCFVDFEADTDLSRYQRIAESVFRAVVLRQGKHLIIGNALPWVAQGGSARVVAKQRAYNAWLKSFAAKHPRVHVFDQYEVLATRDGHLKAEYAVSASDSHLNKAGYAALDVAYFTFLARTFPRPKK